MRTQLIAYSFAALLICTLGFAGEAKADTLVSETADESINTDNKIPQEESREPSSQEKDVLDALERMRQDSLDFVEERREDSLELAEERYEDSLKALEDSLDMLDGVALADTIDKYKSFFTSKVLKSRAQGYGGGVIIQPIILGLSTKPIYDLAKRDFTLKKFHFSDLDEDYMPVMVLGAIPYGGLGHGVRIGFSFWKGDVFFDSDEKHDPVKNVDSIMILNVHVRYSALMLEKNIIKRNLNFNMGGMLGFGSMKVTRSYQNSDAFKPVWNEELYDNTEAKANYCGFEIHGGSTVTVLTWLHIGADINTLFAMSTNGFGGLGKGGFLTANPGIRFRLVFGNLG